MSTKHPDIHHENNNSVIRRPQRAIVWDYFEKIIGDDGLQKTRCTKCQTVYSCAPNSGTSTMRRHLRKCCPQPISQFSPWVNTATSNDELENEARALKKLKSGMKDNLHSKTDRELMEFIWMNKRNIGLLEEKLPDKAVTIKEALKSYEAELERRAKLQRLKENGQGPGPSILAINFGADDQLIAQYRSFGQNVAHNGGALESRTTEAHADVNQKTNPPLDNGNLVIKVEVYDQFVDENENFNRKKAEEERAKRLQIVAIHGDQNQISAQPTTILNHPQDIRTELKKVSSVISMLTSPNSYYTPHENPLDEEAEQAKKSLIELLKKDFKSIVGSPDAQKLKSCVQILVKNLDKLPMFQGRVIESLDAEFETACQNWTNWDAIIQTNIAFEVRKGEKVEVLKEWQEKDVEIEFEIAKVDEDIDRLKDEIREKELTRENLVKQKSDLFGESKISVENAKNLLREMVTAKLQSDVATDNMKDFATKWERIRENFQIE